MKELRDILLRTAKDLEEFTHPRVSIAWQDRDLVYRRVHNPSPDLGQDIVGKKLEDIIGDANQARELTNVKQRVLETGQPFHEVTTLILGGERHILDVSIEPTFNEVGEMDGLISVNIDVTDLVNAREQLAAANARLVKLLDAALGDGPRTTVRRSAH